MPFIAHPQIRNRGTIGGSLAHADPAAELPAVVLALDARFLLRRRGGERWVAAREFYTGLFATALEPDEILVEIEIPPAPARTGWAFQEVSRRHGDFALAGVAAGVTLDRERRLRRAHASRCWAWARGRSSPSAPARCLLGARYATARSTPARSRPPRVAAADDLEPSSDIHASARFRRHLARVLVERSLRAAAADASGSKPSSHVLPGRDAEPSRRAPMYTRAMPVVYETEAPFGVRTELGPYRKPTTWRCRTSRVASCSTGGSCS